MHFDTLALSYLTPRDSAWGTWQLEGTRATGGLFPRWMEAATHRVDIRCSKCSRCSWCSWCLWMTLAPGLSFSEEGSAE